MLDAPRRMRNQPLVALRNVAIQRYSENRHSQDKELVRAFTFHRHTQLAAFVMCISHFVLYDGSCLLPVSVLGYAMAIMLATDQLTGQEISNLQNAVRQRLEHEELQRQYDAAIFEYHVLKGKPKTRIVSKRERDGIVIYALADQQIIPEKFIS